jgi:2-dehydropantoate 2-reductase
VRYIIVGAGAVGGTIGGRLRDSGREVVLVARGAHGEALRERGLRLDLADGARTLRVPVVGGPQELTPRVDDVLVLAVKTQDTASALETWGAYGSEHGHEPAVVCAQNGAENERLALRRFREVHAMCVWLPCWHLEPGVVQAPCTPLTGILHLGRYPSGADDTTRRIAADLEDSGFAAPVTDEVMAWKYGKLLSNLVNAVEAICGQLAEGPPLELYQQAKREGRAVLDAAGIAYKSEEQQASARGNRLNLPSDGSRRIGGSSWQSLMRGTGSIESDYLNGEIVLLGRQLGVPTLVNEALQRAAAGFARDRRPPGDLTADELAALLGFAGRRHVNH